MRLGTPASAGVFDMVQSKKNREVAKRSGAHTLFCLKFAWSSRKAVTPFTEGLAKQKHRAKARCF